MGKGTSKRTVQHFKQLPGGSIGCWIFGCTSPATRWIDWERWGIRRWLSTAYCDTHGDDDLHDSSHRVRPIRTTRPEHLHNPSPD